MRALYYLFWLQSKAKLRLIFSKPSSAIITILILLFYGGIIVYSLTNGDIALALGNLSDINSAILINIGYSALMIFTLLLQKKVALFFENDAFYLFTAPFKRSQIMAYMMLSILLSALLFGAINVMMIIFLALGLEFTLPFLLLVFFTQSLLYLFFLLVLYYVYLISLQQEKKRNLPRILLGVLLVMVLALFAYLLLQHELSLQEALSAFINSPLFYWIPLFGWVKLVLASYISAQLPAMLCGLALLLFAAGGMMLLMLSYKGDFVEQIMQDASEFTKRYQQIKAGKQTSFSNRKVKQVEVNFKEGAWAILSKNLLIMRKTNELFRFQELLSLLVYLLVALVMQLGFTFYCSMLLLWLFMMIQNSDFMQDMNNYQLYLIPEPPFQKLLAAMSAAVLKLSVLLTLAVTGGGILFQEPFTQIFYYLFLLLGYMLLFMSATVLSLRMLKSRSSSLIEGLLRMLIMIVSAVPGIAFMVFAVLQGWWSAEWNLWITIGNVVLNFLISLLLLYFCRTMMNGRELKSE